MLEQLSPDVQSRLRSGVAITNVAQGVEELVLNSIDAEATCVAIRVDMSCCKIQVVDNGRGISKDALEKIAERYTTSKCHSLQDLDERLQHFGYRGEALASMRDISSILEIESRSKQCNQSFTRIFQNGKPQPVSESKTHRPSPGTTITVHNLFSSLPVRRKALNEPLELERVRQRIEAIALIHPNCSFSLRNDVTGTKVLQTHKSNSVLGAFTFLFGNGKARMMTQVSAEAGSVKINGFIGKEGNHNKNMQFIFINDRLVLKTKIHRLINYQVSRSSITRRRGGSDGSPKFISTDKNGSPSRPTSERHGIYVISVTCPLADYDITYDPAKTLVEFKDWRAVLATVRGMVDRFLIEHNLIVKADPKDDDEDGSEYKDLEEALDADSQEDGSGDPGPIASLQRYAAGINTANSVNNLASETVSRPKDIKPDQIVEQLIAEKTEEENRKKKATEEVHNEESVENIPGNSLKEAASRRPPSSNILSDTESQNTAAYCGELMSGKSPLAFMYKTSQESETSDSVDKVQESTPDNTQSGKDKGSSQSSCGSSVEIVSGSETPRPRVRDKTFISLDVASDSSPDIVSKVSKDSELSESELYTEVEKTEDPLIGLSLKSNLTTHHIEQGEKGNSYCNASSEDNIQPMPSVRRPVAVREILQTRQSQERSTTCDSTGSLVLRTSSLEDFKRSMNKSNQSQKSLETARSSSKTDSDESVQGRSSRKPACNNGGQSDSLLSKVTDDRPRPTSPQRTLAIMKQRRHSLRSQDSSNKQNPDTSMIYSDSLGEFKKRISQESQANVHKVSTVKRATATTVCPSITDSNMPLSSQGNLQSTTGLDKLGYECSLDTFRNEIRRLESVKKSSSTNSDRGNEKNKSELSKDEGEALQPENSSEKKIPSTSMLYCDSLGDFKKKISQKKQESVSEHQIEDPLVNLTRDSSLPTVRNKSREEKQGSTLSSRNVSIRNKDNTHQIPPVRGSAAPKPKLRAKQSQDEATTSDSSRSLVLKTSSLEDFKRSMNSLGTSTSTSGSDELVQARPSRKPANKNASQLDSTKDNPCPKSQQRTLAIMRQRMQGLKTQDSASKQDSSTSQVYSDSLGDFKKKISKENQTSVHKVLGSMMASELYRGESEMEDPLIGLTLDSNSQIVLNKHREEKEGSTSSSCNVSIRNKDDTQPIPLVRALAAPQKKARAEQSEEGGTNSGSSGSLVLQTRSMEDFKRSIINQNQKSFVTTTSTAKTVRDESVQIRPSKKSHSWEGCTVETRGHGLNSSSIKTQPQILPCSSHQSLKPPTQCDEKAVEQGKVGHVRCESSKIEVTKTAKCNEVTKPHLLQREKTSSTGKYDIPQEQSVPHVVNQEDSKITQPRDTHQSGPNTCQLETTIVRESSEKTASLSEKSQFQRRHSDDGSNSHSRRVSETDRKRTYEEEVSTVGLPLAAKLSKLSRGETVTVSQPPQISRRKIGVSIFDQMLEDTQAALRKARTSGVQPDSKRTGESDNVTADVSKQSCQKRKLSGFPTEHSSRSGMENLSSIDSEAMKRPKPDLEKNIDKNKLSNVNVQLDVSCPSTHSSEQEGTPKSLSEEARASHFRSPAVKEANECYKAKLYENPFPFSATPVIPSWKEKTGVLWSTSDDEEETPSRSVKDWDYSIKRQKVHLGEEAIASSSSMQGQSQQLEEWKRLQLQTSPVSCIPCTIVNEAAERQYTSLSLEEKNRDFGTALPVYRAPSECEEAPELQERDDIRHVGNKETENVQSESVVENPTESTGGKDCNSDKHSSEVFTIQALDYSIEFESLRKMAIPNMELGSSQPGGSPLHGQHLGTTTPQASTSQSSCTPPRPVDPTVTVEPSQGFATVPDDANTESEASAERSQGFVDVPESQGYVTKDETQRFTPPQQGGICEKSKDDREPEKPQTVCPLPSSEKAPENDENKKSPETHSQPEAPPVKSPEKTLFVGPSWICKLDPNTGRKVFINKITGHSSFSSPKAEDQTRCPVFHIKNPVLPSGATPLLQAESSPLQARPRALRAPEPAASTSREEEDGSHLSAALADHLENQQQEEATEMSIKWRQGSVPPSEGQAHCVRSMLEEWDNPVFKNVEQCGVNVDARSSTKGASRVQQAIHPYKLDKDVLQTIKVLGQLDNKFIACLLDQPLSGGDGRQELLAVIDQHAAHERVRLERLTAEAYAEDGSCINRRDIDPAVIVTLKEEEVRVACAYRSVLQKKGISFKVDSTKRTNIRVHEVPACLVERDLGERKRRRTPITVDTLQTLIIEETEMLNSTHGAGATIPQTVFRALCSQACHGAIKFGDAITTTECEDLVKQLSTCKLPFQCAHGRPSVMPILDLGHLKLHQTQESKIKLWKLR